MSIKLLLLGLGLVQAAGTHVITCNLSETALHNEIRSQECALQYTEGGENVQISEIFNGDKNSKRMLLPQTFYSTHIATPKKAFPDSPIAPPDVIALQEDEMKLSSFPDIIYFSDSHEPYQASTQYIYNSGSNQVTYCSPMGCSTLVRKKNIETQYCVIGDTDTKKCGCDNPLPIGFLPGENVLGAICLLSEHDNSLTAEPKIELYYISPVLLSGVAEFHYRKGHYQFIGPWHNTVLSPEKEVLKSESSDKSKQGKGVGEKRKEKNGNSGEYVLSLYDKKKTVEGIGFFYKYDLSHHLGEGINTFAISHNLHPMTDFTSSLYAVRTQNSLFLVNEKKQESEGQGEEQKEAETEGQQSPQLVEKELYLSKVPEALWPMYVDTRGVENGTIEEQEGKGPRIVIQSFRQETMNPFIMGEASKYGYINKIIAWNRSSLIPITGADRFKDVQMTEAREMFTWALHSLSAEVENGWLGLIRQWLESKQSEQRKENRESVIASAQSQILSAGKVKARMLVDLAFMDNIPLKDLKVRKNQQTSVLAKGQGRQESEEEEEEEEDEEEEKDLNAKYEKVLKFVRKEAMMIMKVKAKNYLRIIDNIRTNYANQERGYKSYKNYKSNLVEYEKMIVEKEINDWTIEIAEELIEEVIDVRIHFFRGGDGLEFYDRGVEERNARANGHVGEGDEERRKWIEERYSKKEEKATVSSVAEEQKRAQPQPILQPGVVKDEEPKDKDYGLKSGEEEGTNDKGKSALGKAVMVAIVVALLALGSFAIYSHKKSKQEENSLLQSNSTFV